MITSSPTSVFDPQETLVTVARTHSHVFVTRPGHQSRISKLMVSEVLEAAGRTAVQIPLIGTARTVSPSLAKISGT